MPFSFFTQISAETYWITVFFADLIVMSFVAVYGFYSYYKRLGELKKIQIDAHKKAEQIVSDANSKSREILEKVEQKADEILTHSELFKKDLNSSFENSLKESREKYLEMIETHSNRFIADYENLLTSVKKQSIEKAGKALDTIEQDVRKSLEDSQNSLKKEVMKSLEKAKSEIEAYKKGEIVKVDRQIDQLVSALAKDLLRLNITPTMHKKLVMQALDKAKEQGMFFL